MNKICLIILLIPGCCTITGNNNSCDFTDSSSEAIDLGDEAREPFLIDTNQIGEEVKSV